VEFDRVAAVAAAAAGKAYPWTQQQVAMQQQQQQQLQPQQYVPQQQYGDAGFGGHMGPMDGSGHCGSDGQLVAHVAQQSGHRWTATHQQHQITHYEPQQHHQQHTHFLTHHTHTQQQQQQQQPLQLLHTQYAY